MIPITTLRVAAAGIPGERELLEVQLSEEQVGQLCEKADHARTKLTSIRKYLDQHSMTVPESAMTRASDAKRGS